MTLDLEVPIGGETMLLPARVQRWQARFLQVVFAPATIEDESQIVQAVFGRADAWMDWDNFPRDRVWMSLWTVLLSIAGLFRRPGRPLARRHGAAAGHRAGEGRCNARPPPRWRARRWCWRRA